MALFAVYVTTFLMLGPVSIGAYGIALKFALLPLAWQFLYKYMCEFVAACIVMSVQPG